MRTKDIKGTETLIVITLITALILMVIIPGELSPVSWGWTETTAICQKHGLIVIFPLSKISTSITASHLSKMTHQSSRRGWGAGG